MSTPPAPSPSPIGTASPRILGRIETDCFCTHCGYNLFTQAVWRDERLGILVVRCPECGAHQPAGLETGIGRVWFHRLGATLLVGWILLGLGVVAGALLCWGIAQAGYIETHTSWEWGQSQQWRLTWRAPSPYALRETWIIVGLLSAVPAILVGLGLANLLWHWRRWTSLLACGLPLLPALVVYPIYASQELVPAPELGEWIVRSTLGIAALQIGVLAVAIMVGRPIGRALVRMFIPPRLRQHLIALWLADGLDLPPVQRKP